MMSGSDGGSGGGGDCVMMVEADEDPVVGLPFVSGNEESE